MNKRNHSIIKSISCLVLITSFNYFTTLDKSIAGNLPPVIDTIAPSIALIGSNDTTIEVYNSFNDPGVSVHDNHTPDNKITIIKVGLVDISRIGSYPINYSATDSTGNISDTVTRTVNIVDTTAPIISLMGGHITICVPDTFVDPGYAVTDNYWSNENIVVDVFGSFYDDYMVNFQPGVYIISYLATDSSGNVTDIVSRNIIALDNSTAITVVLQGDSIVTLELNNTFNDPGIIASHPYLSKSRMNIIISGQVNTSKTGTYVLKYSATGPCAITSDTVTRTVHVKDSLSNINPDQDKFFKVYPNPNNGRFIVKIDLIEKPDISISIHNILGSTIFKKKVVKESNLQYEFDISDYNKGIYFLKIESQDKQAVIRIIKN